MGTHMIELSKSLPMNTNVTVFENFCILVPSSKVFSESKGLIHSRGVCQGICYSYTDIFVYIFQSIFMETGERLTIFSRHPILNRYRFLIFKKDSNIFE